MLKVLLLEISRGGTRQGCVPLPAGAGSRRRSPRLHGWDNRQCSGQRSSFHGGRPSCEGLRLAVEVAVCGLCGTSLGCGGVRTVLLPTPASPFPSPSCLWRRTGTLTGGRGGGSRQEVRRRQGREVQATGEAEGMGKQMDRTLPLESAQPTCPTPSWPRGSSPAPWNQP